MGQKIPNPDQAVVSMQKLTQYLLSETHAVGKAKAKFFRSQGYNENNAGLLADGLIFIANSEEIKKEVASPYGVKYIIDGNLITPNKNEISIRTVWVIESHDNRPRFVTAYPV